ncbi:toll/interleukin-1 receptor domain-containing protein [Candidatus Protofrankia californiensis]|uniref:toll/interleukin-1 receptor domain-containing protein n=1 Tax=Candidatus Protofrankia californiensis TaxID=1839754 RepID=UPI0013EB5D1F|nr:toll/interleukin-1 receptor domain-containing protein [Candidatus Protofrankia californiensis]
MSLIFISYASQDRAEATLLKNSLTSAGLTGVFLDYDPSDGVPPSARWEKHIWQELRRSDAVVFLGTRHSADSQWCHSELSYAQIKGIPIFPVLLEPDLEVPLLADSQWRGFLAGEETSTERNYNVAFRIVGSNSTMSYRK